MSDYSISLSCMYVSMYQTPTYSILASNSLSNNTKYAQRYTIFQSCPSVSKFDQSFVYMDLGSYNI